MFGFMLAPPPHFFWKMYKQKDLGLTAPLQLPSFGQYPSQSRYSFGFASLKQVMELSADDDDVVVLRAFTAPSQNSSEGSSGKEG